MTRAVISLGTNTTRVLVVRDTASGGVEQLEHRQTGTRLGEGLLDGGALAADAVERTLRTVSDYVRVVRGYDAELFTIATSAVRRADDATAFCELMRARTGVPLDVLPGTVEAEASYRGATYGTATDGKRVAVLDVGGGSTECAVGRDGVLDEALSIEIGSVRVAERFPALLGGSPGAPARAAATAARAALEVALQPLRALAPIAELRCVAGTPLTLAAVIARSDVARMSGTLLTLRDLDEALERLLDLRLDERQALPGMQPQRADIIPGGALVLSEAWRALGVERALLEANDLLLGYLLLQRKREAARAE